MQEIIKEFVVKELEKESFVNDSKDICFLSMEDMEKAVQRGLENITKKLKG